MDILIWIVISLLFILSFIGLIYPIIPSVLVIWGAVLLYTFLIDGAAVSWWLWGSYILLTIVLFAADYAAGLYFVKKYGSSRAGTWASAAGIIIGCFVLPPFGILIVPFALVFLTEAAQNRGPKEAARTAVGTLLGFLAGTAAKALIQLMMIALFLLQVWVF
ncbi:DUF456 domain-containing protein [Alkalicoccus urumqiensis]|uniref:DUF456 domain-containing protein n=1 Tax=Alkalicoccus urumqiensis TaxID=1548213 RepID=A0A2P6MEU6_ALKUR|nr:DUF456 domain-containing protein [Alkalicoccus urumqiensis]PRO64808.1 DUF456 domain-containing protein [Alkalicoccus urumqiensis]